MAQEGPELEITPETIDAGTPALLRRGDLLSDSNGTRFDIAVENIVRAALGEVDRA